MTTEWGGGGSDSGGEEERKGVVRDCSDAIAVLCSKTRAKMKIDTTLITPDHL